MCLFFLKCHFSFSNLGLTFDDIKDYFIMPSCDVFYFYGFLFESAGSLLRCIRTHLSLIYLLQQRIVNRLSIRICLFTCCISKVYNYSSISEFNEIALLLWAQIIPAIRLLDYVFFLIASCLYWFNCMRGNFTWWYFGVDLKKLINGNYTYFMKFSGKASPNFTTANPIHLLVLLMFHPLPRMLQN